MCALSRCIYGNVGMGTGCPGGGVTGNLKSPGVGLGNETPVLWKNNEHS